MSELVAFDIDLAGHEQARLAAHLTASIADLDLLAVYADECRAARMLYSNLATKSLTNGDFTRF